MSVKYEASAGLNSGAEKTPSDNKYKSQMDHDNKTIVVAGRPTSIRLQNSSSGQLIYRLELAVLLRNEDMFQSKEDVATYNPDIAHIEYEKVCVYNLWNSRPEVSKIVFLDVKCCGQSCCIPLPMVPVHQGQSEKD